MFPEDGRVAHSAGYPDQKRERLGTEEIVSCCCLEGCLQVPTEAPGPTSQLCFWILGPGLCKLHFSLPIGALLGSSSQRHRRAPERQGEGTCSCLPVLSAPLW